MKRKITADKPTPLKAPGTPRAQERELEQAAAYMIEQISQRFRTQALKGLHESTIDQFEDAQPGNYAKVFLRLANRTRRKLLKQFDDDRIEELTRKVLDKVNRRNRSELYAKVEQRIGLSTKELTATEGLMADINALNLETATWIKKLRDETLEMYTTNSLHAMTTGSSLEEIMQQFDGLVEKRKNHAQFTARNQIGNFNSITTKLRAQNLGITEAIWRTSRDERVRRCHAVRHGKTFELSEGLYSSCDGKYLLPGIDYQCFPGSVQINNSSLCQKLYRRGYTGELAEIICDDGVILTATPNHPILTVGGFKAAGLIDTSDQVVRALDQRFDTVKFNGQNVVPTFEQIFSTLDLLGVKGSIAPAIPGQFHGDASDSDIDVISMDSLLMNGVNVSIREKFKELDLPEADQMVILEALTCLGEGGSRFDGSGDPSASIVRSLDLLRSGLLIHLGPLELFGFAMGAWANPGSEQALTDGAPVNAEVYGDCVFAFSVLVHGYDFLNGEIEHLRAGSPGRSKAYLTKSLGQEGRMNPDLVGGITNEGAITYKLCGVKDSRIRNFSGHVYNLQTVSGDYIADTTAVSNCRCDYELIIPEDDD